VTLREVARHADHRIAVEDYAWTLLDAVELHLTAQIDPLLLRRICTRMRDALDNLARYEATHGIHMDRSPKTVADIVLAAEAALEIEA
jgi:hypothetical protein